MGLLAMRTGAGKMRRLGTSISEVPLVLRASPAVVNRNDAVVATPVSEAAIAQIRHFPDRAPRVLHRSSRSRSVMSTTLSMWLGIAFVVFAVVATILQAWLWSFPMVPDPGGPDPNGRSTAPRFWTQMHRLLGGLYVLIYVVLMVEMIPRLWEYQVELPARTVMHAVMGIVIGVMLVAKIAIIRWFQHFGTSLPALGLGLLAATIVLATLSIPFAVRAHDFGAITTAENVERVKRVLNDIPWEDATKERVDALVTADAFAAGQRVLAGKCTDCHDIRTILQRPRSGEG
jgi:hypothetical protein